MCIKIKEGHMALPSYNKAARRKSYTQLPKGAYVLRIIGAREEQNKSGSGTHLTIAFDVAEGEYAGIYQKQHESDTSKPWPNDGMFYLTVPTDGCQAYVMDNWNTFFADLEDSNNGFVFSGDPKMLKGKFIGGKFRLEEHEYNGKVYSNTKMVWTCVADDVRKGNAGRMPNDKKLAQSAAPAMGDDFVALPDGMDDDELPF